MTYAKKILALLLVFCVLFNLTSAVFAEGEDEPLPEDTVVEEDPVLEETEPPGEEVPGDEKPPDETQPPDETVPPEGTEETVPAEEEVPPTESTDEEAAPEEPTEDAPQEEPPEDTEEATEPPLEEAPAEEIVVTDDAEMTAEITAANDVVMPMATGVEIVHCGNAILTDAVGTLSFEYYSYLDGAKKTAHMQVIEEKRINGVVAYCIQPEMTSGGKNYTEAEQKDAWNRLPSEMRQAIVLAIAYGYPQETYSADPNDIYYKQTASSNKQNMLNGENYIATQLIIWEFLCGKRSCYEPFALTGGTSFRNVCDGGWATIRTTYDAIAAKLAAHNSIPAYASRSQTAYVYELKYNKGTGTYRYMLPAERQSTKRNCDIQLPGGVRYLYASDGKTVIGFEATVAAAESLLKNGYTASGATPSVSVDPDKAVACWTCEGSQTVVTTLKTKPDPAKAYFTLKLAAAGSLTGMKTTSVPNGSVEGFRFKFYSWTDNREWYAKTDAAGNLCLSDSNYSTLGTTQITGLSEGKYDMLEVLSQDSLIFPDSWTVTVTDADGNTVSSKTYTPTKESNGNYAIRNVEITGLAAGGTVTMTINNAPLEAPLEIYKTSPNGNVKDIEFYVTDASGNEVGRDVTDDKGKIEIEGLRIGQTYTVTEVVPEGSICENNNQKITIQAGTNTLTFVNHSLVLKLVKQSSDGNKEGITFQIFAGDTNHTNGKVWKTMTTDANGGWEISPIPAGVYWIHEVVPQGYAAQEDQRIEVTSANTENNPAVVTFVNEPLVLKLVKQSPDGNKEGITFQIFAGDTNHTSGAVWKTMTTDVNGGWEISGIPAGVYWIHEVVPQGYAAQEDQRIEVTSANTENNPAVVTFVNEPLVLKLVKESPDGKKEGITFQIFAGDTNHTNGKVWKTMTTDANGGWEISPIPAGVYWIHEVVPEGYAAQEDQRIAVTTANTENNPAVVTFVNEPLVLKLVKESPDGKKEGITFQIFAGDTNHTNGTVWKTMTTDANGGWEISPIPAGVYWIHEVVPQGYAAQEDQRIEVTTTNTENNPAVVTFVNELLVLKLVKQSPDGNKEGITFQIFDGDTNHTNGKVWKTMTTDANGGWEISPIPAGVYWIHEVVPQGYAAQEDQRIEVTSANTENNPAVVTFVNEPLVLKIVKQSPDGNNEGISFQIFKSASDRINGNVWQTVVTGEDGSITLEKLTPGTYWVREIVPQGYAPQEDQSVTVTTDNTPENPATVTFVNVPLSAIKVIKTSPDGNVEGITFQLFEGDLGHNKETVFAEGKTDANGEILFTNLDPSSMVSRGVYWVREIVPEGYAPQEDQCIVITAANTPGNPAVVTFDNIPLYGSITVNKVNTADTPLAGATFLLEYSTDDGTTWTAVKPATEEENGIGTCSTVGEDGTLTTGEDGQVKFENLIVLGVTYRLTETVAPAGYQLLAEPVFTGGITANEESSYEIYRTVVNVPLLQMPPTGGDGSVRIIGMVSTLVAAASICALTLLLRKRKENG